MTQKPKNNIDDNVDDLLFSCLNPSAYKSFFLFAGAGSGKTRSLVNVLGKFKDTFGNNFRVSRQKVAIITYTNAAANEISHRLEYNPIFTVSTIHSFCWKLIQTFTNDIRDWLKINLTENIEELNQQQGKSRDLNNKTSRERERSISSKGRRLGYLDDIVRFTYNPNGDNDTKDSLNHSEVISIAAYFINQKPLMQEILICRNPIILVDESQDTKKELIEGLFSLQKNHSSKFSLGLFGDTMQRIYSDGKEDLGINLPKDWLQPSKLMNHRSNKRIISLVNDIRRRVDGKEQIPRSEKQDGYVRMFISNRQVDKEKTERLASEKMVNITKDSLWLPDSATHKALILEHHMAAARMGFLPLFKPLHEHEKTKTGLIDGTLSGLNFFRSIILPVIEASKLDDKVTIARIVKQHSKFLRKDELRKNDQQTDNLKQANAGLKDLFALWAAEADPKLIDILRNIHSSGLFPIPDTLYPFAKVPGTDQSTDTDKNLDDSEMQDDLLETWSVALQCGFSTLINYDIYQSDSSKFGTHQGVKGLEYPRVMVIVDDEEAKGFMFSYDKLFGIKNLSPSDQKNMQEGKETGMDRTRRLFYVACSRAKESLAIVAYTNTPEILKSNVVKYGWFAENEVEII